jgi:diguanylate cyclase (GGDEF)-like protein/PAS domain S-box-containing protein
MSITERLPAAPRGIAIGVPVIDRGTVLRGLALGSGFAAAVWVSAGTGGTGGSGGTAPVWLGNGFQLAVLLLIPRRSWPGCLAGFTVISAVVVLIVDGSVTAALATSLVNLVEVAIAAHLLARDPDWVAGRSDSTLSWLRFARRGVVVAPLAGTALGLVVLLGLDREGLGPAALWGRAHVWFVTDAVSICLLVPLALRVRPAAVDRLRREGRLREAVLLLLVTAGVAGLVTSQGSVIALFAVMPPLIVLLFRFGFVGLTAGTAVLAAFTLGLTRAGHGPFVTMTEGSTGQAVLVAQLFLVSVFGTVATIGALLEERQELAAREAANEQVYRLIAASSSDLILVLTDDGAARYVSPAATELAGRPETALLGLGWLQQLHPDDRDALVGAFNAVRDGAETGAEVLCRLRRSERDWRWLECRLRSGDPGAAGSTGSAGTATAAPGPLIVATVRDVTGRREYEENLRTENALLAREASTDALTGLANRREFEHRLADEWARAAAARQQVGLVVVDVDHFKKYNDRYGHAAGDRCLAAVARALHGTLRRPSDLCARYGGEEFVVLLPTTHRAGSAAVAEALCAAVRGLALEHRDNDGGVVTISAGVACLAPARDDATPERLFQLADAALYRAKDGGRDRAEMHTEPSTEHPTERPALAGT